MDARFEIAKDQVSQIMQLPRELIFSNTRQQEFVDARRYVIAYLVFVHGYGFSRIGRLIKRHPSTIHYTYPVHQNMMESNSKYAETFGLIIRRCNALLIKGAV